MKAWESVGQVTNTFPITIAKPCSGSGATDGTPIMPDTTNNYWGFFQMIMSRAGLTPSGVLEAYTVANAFSHSSPGQATITLTTAQFLQALQMQFGGPGTICLYARNQAPATVGERILLLQGQTIATATYPDLCNAVYVGDALNNTAGVPFYLSSDSGGVTRSTTGAYLTLPDARGVTIRGIDTAQARDPLGNSRGGAAGAANGSIELDALQGHFHGMAPAATGFVYLVASGGTGQISAGSTTATALVTGAPATDGTNGTPRVDKETRMINMACYIGIRY